MSGNYIEEDFNLLERKFILCKYNNTIPTYTPSFEDVSKQMRINLDVLKKEFSDHVDSEIERFNKNIKK